MSIRAWLSIAVGLHLCCDVAVAQPADRSQPPGLGPASSIAIPEIVEFKLKNGLTVYLVEDGRLPLVQLTWVFNGGGTSDPNGKAGLASFVADMLDEGAGGMSALKLADELEYLGVSMESEARRESNRLSLFTSKRLMDQGLALLATMLIEPEFPKDEIERIRTARLTDYLRRYDQPREVAVEIFLRTVFGQDHPMSFSAAGYPSTLKSITREDLLDYHKRHYRPKNGFLVVTGDIDRTELERSLDRHFSRWRGGKWLERRLPEPQPPRGVNIFLIDRPGAVQSNIRIGRVGVGRRSQDYYPVQVMNTVLGGTYEGRLNQNIRVRNGYAYGAHSDTPMLRDTGIFWAVSQVQNDATGKALREFFNEFERIQEPVAEEELNRVRDYLSLSYPFEFTTLQSQNDNVLRMVLYHLDDTVFLDHVAKINAVTSEDVRRVADQLITPDDMVVIVVGDVEKIESDVEALNLGALTKLSIEDVLGPKPKIN